jgi:hypothetical protein
MQDISRPQLLRIKPTKFEINHQAYLDVRNYTVYILYSQALVYLNSV